MTYDASTKTSPGHQDAGKALGWLSEAISKTDLVEDLKSKDQERCDAQIYPQSAGRALFIAQIDLLGLSAPVHGISNNCQRRFVGRYDATDKATY